MPQVLTTNAVITCPHGGLGTTVPTAPLWSVQGGTVCAEGDAGTLSCVFIVPCVGYTLRSMGLNATTIAGRKAILATDFQQTITGLPLTIVETNTTFDNSTPAPIPAGQSAPPLSAELSDNTKPVVVAAPPVVPFVTSTMMPASAPVAFTLTHPHPLQWMLTLINGTTGVHADVTSGLPGLVVAPAGGAWNSSTLVVTATMTAAFMAALSPGTHYLYMTGVSQRGLSAYAQATITVS